MSSQDVVLQRFSGIDASIFMPSRQGDPSGSLWPMCSCTLCFGHQLKINNSFDGDQSQTFEMLFNFFRHVKANAFYLVHAEAPLSCTSGRDERGVRCAWQRLRCTKPAFVR